MSLSVFRIVKEKYAAQAFDGEGARLFGGHWNHPGTSLVYTSESLSLAALELLVHLDNASPSFSLVKIQATIPDEINIKSHPAKNLNTNECRDDGSRWAEKMKEAILKVPSAIIPTEHNYLINPLHPDFQLIKISKAEPFLLDKRLLNT